MMAVVAFGLVTCQKETINPPTVKVFEGAITINFTKAGVSAEVTDQGGAEVKSRGFVYGISGGTMDTVFCGSGMGVYSADLNNLQPNTSYVYEAFASNVGGTGTSGKVTFTTQDYSFPTVKTTEATNVGATTAQAGGNVTADGGANVTERGMCWGTNHNPTISGSHDSAGGGLGEYTCNMSNLSANTTYYVRAYAKNSKGIAYGEEKEFTTLDFDLPEVTTANVSDITQTTAKAGGEVTDDGGTTVTDRGICWGTNHNPTVNDHKVPAGQGMGNFTANITGLNAHMTYYVRAYAINSKGTAYGEEVSFTTAANPPTVSTGSVTNITTTSAAGSGTVISDGGSPVTGRGLCWSTNHNPAIGGTHVEAGSGTGEFTATMTHLSPNTTYYVRAYATNGVSTSYGDEVPFTTPNLSVPSVTTASVTNINNTTATGGGNVTANGGATVTERGICWSTSHNPTISGSHSSSGTGTGGFTVNMANLTPNTTYYVKAYAINSQGTGYGEEVNFKTSQTPTYTISVSTNPTNGGTVTGGGTYQQGQSCTVKATPATGYTFQKWTKNGTQVSTNSTYTFNVTASASYVAHFQLQTYTISASANPTAGGTVTGGGTYSFGQNCTLKANAAAGYTFQKWTKNGQQVSTNPTYTFSVTASASYVAHFQQQTGDQTFTVNGVSFTMKGVAGGTFWMGAQSANPNGQNYDSEASSVESPVHSVTLSTFYMGETEVTQELWQAVMGSNPSYFSGTNRPVEQVSWNMIVNQFIPALNALTGRTFRLPTEAEWEYAARGGNQGHGYKYAGSNTIWNVAWFSGNSGGQTHQVATKSPNELGLYDMSGNVWEWCSDWYGSYGSGSQTNPQGPSSGSFRVLRGGSWINSGDCRVSRRLSSEPGNTSYTFGFRLVLSQ